MNALSMQRMKEGKCDEMTRYAQVYRFARVAYIHFCDDPNEWRYC